jgi:uncharacterized protein YegL
LVRRPLHFFWVLDCSQSMQAQGKMDALNNAVRATIPALQDAAHENPHADLLVRTLAFARGAHWHIEDPTPIDQVAWYDLQAFGRTDMGLALREVAGQLVDLPSRALPPAIILVSDGQPTDDFADGLAALQANPWGQKAVRIAVAIGGDADLDVLRAFMDNPELEPLHAGNPDELAHHLRWASTAATRIASTPIAGANAPAPMAPYLPEFEPVSGSNQLLTW